MTFGTVLVVLFLIEVALYIIIQLLDLREDMKLNKSLDDIDDLIDVVNDTLDKMDKMSFEFNDVKDKMYKMEKQLDAPTKIENMPKISTKKTIDKENKPKTTQKKTKKV